MAEQVDNQGAMSATFDDYVSGGQQVTAEATPDTPVAPAPVVATPLRDESGKFVAAVEPKVDEPAAQTSAPTDLDAKARELGWKPLDEFGGDPRKWVEARVWVENAPLVAQIKSSKNKIREQNKALETARIHHAKVYESAYQKAMADLAEAKNQAIVEQDVARVNAIDQETARLSSERMRNPPPAPSVDPSYTDWIEANPTIVNDPSLKSFAVAYEQTLMATEPDIDKRLDLTTQAVRQAFPDRFKNVRRQVPAMVESQNGGAAPVNGNARKFSVNDLNADERTVMSRLVNSGVLTQDQYLKDAQETRSGTYTLDIN